MIPQTPYRKVNNEHEELLNNIQQLYEIARLHCKNEESLLDLRNKLKPDTHLNIDMIIDDHKQAHQKLLDKIKGLKDEVIHHIQVYDIIHLHKL